MNRLGASLFALALVSCGPDLPNGDPNDVGRATDRLIRFRLQEMDMGIEQDSEERLEAPEPFAARIYRDCQYQAAHPELLGEDLLPRGDLEACPEFDFIEYEPDAPGDCEEALCYAVAANCVAERLFAISRQVENYETRYADVPGKIVEGVDDFTRLVVPPQSASANAVLVEVASSWAGHAIRISGENLRLGFGVTSSPGGDAICENSTSTANGLFRSTNTIADVLVDEESQSYAEAFVSTLYDSAQLQATLSAAVVESFSAVAEAEHSRNASSTAAARFAWTEGRTSRSYAAQILIGGERGGGLLGVPNGYGRLGSLERSEQIALQLLRAVGIDPASIEPGDDEDSIVLAVRDALRLQTGLVDLSEEEMLDSRGLTKSDVLVAARWLDEAISVFSLNRTATLEEGISGSGTRYAASATLDVVPPDAMLIARARVGADDVLEDDGSSTGWETLSGDAGRTSLAASIDYAADIVSELGSKLSVPPVGIATDVAAAVASGAQATTDLRAGRFRLCVTNDGFGQPTGFTAAYAGSEDVIVVRGRDSLRCAETGSLHGAPCSITAFGGSPTTSMIDVAGTAEVTSWSSAALFSSASEVYLLREVPGEGGNFEALVGGRFPSTTAVGEHCAYFHLVPDAHAAAAELLRPNLTSLDRAATSCVGIPSDQRIPLEDELSNDGDAFESSWRHYLELAAAAAAEADRLGEAVLNNGLEVERRVELASAALEGVCGGEVDIDFLSTMDLAPDPSICASASEGDVVTNATMTARYVCRGGVGMPDAMSTIELQAEQDDPNAQAILRCLGENGISGWVSLGSTPLCLWEDATGSACVGAADAGLRCPVLRGAPAVSCAVQLADAITAAESALSLPPASLAAVTVDNNLGVFADEIHADPVAGSGTPPPEDPTVAPPCEDLRRLRSTASDVDKAAALVALMGHSWMSQTSVGNEARRLSWQALPYDHGRLRRDDAAWAWTGDPERGSYPTGQWPCGVPLEADLADMGSGAGTCDTTGFGTADAGPLGCSFTLCTESGDTSTATLLDRVRLNQRIGRATVALRLMTAEGMRDMALPTNITHVDGDKIEQYFLTEGPSASSLLVPTARYHDIAGLDLTASILGLSGPTVSAREFSFRNERRDVDGSAYCVEYEPCDITTTACTSTLPSCSTSVGGCDANSAAYLWTFLDSSTYAGETTCSATCLSENDCTHCGRLYSPCSAVRLVTDTTQRRAPFLAQRFQGDESEPTAEAAAIAVTRFWPGVGASGARDVPNSIIRDTLVHFAADNAPGVAVPDIDMVRLGGDYWRARSNVRLMEELTYGDVMDGLELACASARADLDMSTTPGAGGVSNDRCSPGRLGSLEAGRSSDLTQLEDFLTCSADLIETNAENMVLRDLPNEVVDSVRASAGMGTIPNLEGARGALVGDVTADIISLRTYRIQLGQTLREFSAELQLLRNDLEVSGVQRELMKIDLTSQISERITACISASSPSITLGTTMGPTSSLNIGAAIATCTNSGVQIGLAVMRLNRQLRLAGLEDSSAFTRFSASYQAKAARLGQIEVELIAAGHRLQGSLARFDQLRRDGSRSLGQAMLFGSDSAGRQLRVNTLLRRRFATSQARYERAKTHALRMSYLARLALEQRLGVRLADLRSDLTLVEAPASWEASLCTLKGLDFSRIRDVNETSFESYADQYIGDYVDRLARTAESYRLDFPFHEGTDTAVVSMRDGLLGVRAVCGPGSAGSPNLLADSSDLTGPAWSTADTCVETYIGLDEAGDPFNDIRNCITRSSGVDTDAVLAPPSSSGPRGATPWRIRFGPPDGGGTSSANPDTRLVQYLPSVDAGTYLLSWFGRYVAPPIDPSDAVAAWVDGTEVALSVQSENIHAYAAGETGVTCDVMANDGWCRYFAEVSLRRRADMEVAIVPHPTDLGTVFEGKITASQIVELGGLQLERVTEAFGPMAAAEPGAYFETDHEGTTAAKVCEDTEGLNFRDGWRYDCDRLCRAGFRTDCDDEDAELVCYWERSFEISPEDLVGRGRLAGAGFALGNYNYRTERLGLNFVGTGIRDCSRSAAPSTCFASGYVSYSIEHLGPYSVQNHQGDWYEAPLFTGAIEYARGLSAERYLTNPLSSADRGLIEPYARSEFRGRPLAGQYIVRLWDDGGIAFENLEDIQILLDYRYWTRFR